MDFKGQSCMLYNSAHNSRDWCVCFRTFAARLLQHSSPAPRWVAEAASSNQEQHKLGFQATAILDNNKSQSNIGFYTEASKTKCFGIT